MAERWVLQTELAEISGFHVKSLQLMYRREPGVLVTRREGNKTEYKLPDCIVNLLKREREAGVRSVKAQKTKKGDDSLSKRKLEAETRMAELELEELEGDLIRLDVHEKRLDAICERISAVLEVIPSKFLSRIQVARDEIAAQEVGEAIRDDTKAALFGIADDLSDEPTEPEEPPAA